MASLFSRLPAMILAGRAHQIHSILRLTGDQQFRINVSRIDKVLRMSSKSCWSQAS